jgi:hypothetical protein
MRLPPEQRKLAKRAAAQGWKIKHTRGDHVVWVAPNGKKLYSAATPSDVRALKNHLARMRKAGFRER